jgi:hypothetical protein
MKFYVTIQNALLGSSTSLFNESRNTRIIKNLVKILEDNSDMSRIEYSYFCELAGMETRVIVSKGN